MTIPEVIEFFWRDRGYAPTFREVAGMMGQSLAWTYEQLDRLRSGGIVKWEDGIPRTLRTVRMK